MYDQDIFYGIQHKNILRPTLKVNILNKEINRNSYYPSWKLVCLYNRDENTQ